MAQHGAPRPGQAKTGAGLVSITHAAWDAHAVHGVHAMYSVNIPHSVEYQLAREGFSAGRIRVGREPAMTGYARRRDDCG